jgi:FAD/FMN-containing dehydrogenase
MGELGWLKYRGPTGKQSRILARFASSPLGEFDHETQAFGLATTLGVVSLTGIGGLTLGGGLGWLNGKYGLACDNVLAADVVTADGEFITASPAEHEDLYWALRGAAEISASLRR